VRILVATLVLSALAIADPAFTGLATNRDGSILYFSSSLRLKNSAQPLWPKIFVWTPQEGVKLYLQRDAGKISVSQDWGSLASYRLFAPSISADGSTVAITAASDCNWGTPCRTQFETFSSTISVSGKLGFAMQGSAVLSPNGRYALLLSSRIQGTGAADRPSTSGTLDGLLCNPALQVGKLIERRTPAARAITPSPRMPNNPKLSTQSRSA
jgi:hypothetical protein